MIGGMIQAGIDPLLIIGSAKTEATIQSVRKTFNIHMTNSNREVAEKADIILLGIKPNHYFDIIDEIKDKIQDHTILITIAAGITIERMEEAVGKPVKIVRTMPNTPSLVGEGMTAVTFNPFVTTDEAAEIQSLLESFGKVEIIHESMMDVIPSISGSSPAYVYMMIEAMADGGVAKGLSRDQAYRLAAQAILGAAKMVLHTGEHPGVLKDAVCSPGGATIEAVSTLEKKKFRGAILEAMEACTGKVQELGRKQ